MSTTTAANKRLDVVEDDLKHLSEAQGEQGRQLATVAAEVNSIGRVQHETSGKLDQLLARGAGSEAVKGMIPSTNVMWGIGLLITLISVGISALAFFSSNITEDIKHGADKRIIVDKSLENQINKLNDDILSTTTNYKRDIINLDTALQREMRDLDQIGQVRDEALDKFLQMEFNGVNNLTTEKLKNIKDELDLRVENLESIVGKNTLNLSEDRWRKKDQEEFFTREFDPLQDKVSKIAEDRFTKPDFDDFVKTYHLPLMKTVNKLEVRISEVVAEEEIQKKVLADRAEWIKESQDLTIRTDEAVKNLQSVEDLDEKINRIESEITSQFLRKDEIPKK